MGGSLHVVGESGSCWNFLGEGRAVWGLPSAVLQLERRDGKALSHNASEAQHGGEGGARSREWNKKSLAEARDNAQPQRALRLFSY